MIFGDNYYVSGVMKYVKGKLRVCLTIDEIVERNGGKGIGQVQSKV